MKRKHERILKSIGSSMIAQGIKIAGLEEIARRQNIALDAHRERLAEHDECLAGMTDGNPCHECKTLIKEQMLEDSYREHLAYCLKCRDKTALKIEGLEKRSAHIEAETHSLLNGNYNQRLEQLERTKDVQSDVSNRQAAVITALQKEVAALRDSQKSNLVMEKRPVGRPRPKVPK
jgi:hypothetical protein